MLRRVVNIVMVVVLALTAFSAFAAANDSGPDAPLALVDGWVELQPDEMHWYAFAFDYEDDLTTPIEIKLFNQPEESAMLMISNQEQVDLWKRDGEELSFGCCSPVSKDADHDGYADYRMWAGLPEASGVYYVIVEPVEGFTGTSMYRLEFSGENMTMLGDILPMAAEPAAVVEPAAATMGETEPAILMGDEGSSPYFALAPTGEWTQLEPGVKHWYVFHYDEDDGWDIVPEIKLYAEPLNDVVLTLHNADQVEQWVLGEELVHFGCCTPADIDKNDDGVADRAVWAGDLDSSGFYYIVVEAGKGVDTTTFYRFELTGEGVAF